MKNFIYLNIVLLVSLSSLTLKTSELSSQMKDSNYSASTNIDTSFFRMLAKTIKEKMKNKNQVPTPDMNLFITDLTIEDDKKIGYQGFSKPYSNNQEQLNGFKISTHSPWKTVTMLENIVRK